MMKLEASEPGSAPIPSSVRDAVSSVDPAELRHLVEGLSIPRAFGTPGNLRARWWVADQLAAAWGDRSKVAVDESGNVILGDPRTARTLVGAHYDAVPGTPGADDNASSVAALIALARATGPADAICCVAFNGEEAGLVGSRGLASRLGPNRLEQVHVLEMVGFARRDPGSQRNPVPPLTVPDVGDFLGIVGTHRSRRSLDHVRRAARSHPLPVVTLRLPMVPLRAVEAMAPHVFRSDHAPFWDLGLPALMWTDTAEFRNPHYHQPTDTPDTLDYDFLANVARLLVHAALTVE